MGELDGKSILITGGTGSFGRHLVNELLKTNVIRIVVFSRDELKQLELRSKLPADERLRFFLGDIRDEERLKIAFHGVSHVVHAAALKQVDTGEYNPMEFVRTNVLGSQNVINSAIASGVSKVIALSTDKASSPINLYGATKLTADKLFTAANNYSHAYGTSLSVVRYGNVMGSRGSVVPYFQDLYRRKLPIPITDLRMTRFWITIQQAVDFVMETFEMMKGGELYVPKIPSMKILDLAKVIAPNSKIIEIGIRPGEKLHEEMISPDDSRRTIQLKKRYVVNPIFAEWGYANPPGEKVLDGFSYRSDTNTEWLNKDQLRKILSET
jgi:UDP-N-acetylglucosamine 4,6-dehydratase/5-epimerase